MEISLNAYNFLAEKNNWTKVSNLEELDNGCKEHNIKKSSIMINISDCSLMSTLYVWGTDCDDDYIAQGLIKVIDGEVTEYYTTPPKNFNVSNVSNVSTKGMVVSRDLSTDEILEYYLLNIQDDIIVHELKYDMEGQLLQTNHVISKFDQLPEEYQNALNHYPDKDKINLYADKPYGKVVEVNLLGHN